jgi:hypothetical protein
MEGDIIASHFVEAKIPDSKLAQETRAGYLSPNFSDLIANSPFPNS